MRQPLNLLWKRPTLDFVLEGQFIKEVLLAQIGRPIRAIVIQDNAPIPFMNDLLVATLGPDLAGYLRELRTRGFRNIGVFHMADEQGDHDRSFYAHADYVLRHYWFEHAMARPNEQSLGVIWAPNGYRTGVGPIAPATMLGTAERSLMGFFSGAMEARTLMAERKQMVQVVRDAKLPFLVAATPGFGQGTRSRLVCRLFVERAVCPGAGRKFTGNDPPLRCA